MNVVMLDMHLTLIPFIPSMLSLRKQRMIQYVIRVDDPHNDLVAKNCNPDEDVAQLRF